VWRIHLPSFHHSFFFIIIFIIHMVALFFVVVCRFVVEGGFSPAKEEKLLPLPLHQRHQQNNEE
jgi:hypothetical protein